MKIISRTYTSHELGNKFVTEIKEKHENPEKWRGLSYGHADLDKLTGGLRKGEFAIIAGAQKSGKCLGLGTPVMMSDGSTKPVEGIQVGDYLMGDDSTPRKVLSLARGNDKLYEITLSNGESFVCNADHILVLKREGMPTIKKGKRRNGEIVEISVSDYTKKTNDFKRKYRPYKVPVDFPERPVLIEPYYLGLWLGDGTSESTDITTADPEIVEYLEKYAKRIGHKVVHVADTGKAATWGIRREPRDYSSDGKTLQTIMRKMGLIDNKHVPDTYLFNSKEIRLEVLAGLINSDGNRTKHTLEFNNTNERLADACLFLARSVGLRATKRTKYLEEDYPVYTIEISGDIDKIPHLLAYKYPYGTYNVKEWDRYSMKVKDIGDGDYYGFEIDGNGRFLLGDFTVTHNTTAAMSMAMQMAKQVQEDEKVLFVSLEMGRDQIAGRALANLSEIDVTKFRDLKLKESDWSKLDNGLRKFEKLPILWNMGASTMEAIEELVEEYNNIRVIVVDYFQLMLDDGRSIRRRFEVLENISTRLKRLTTAKKLSVLAISQQSREAMRSLARQKDSNTLAGTQSLVRDCDILLLLLPYIEDGEEVAHLRQLYVSLSRSSAAGDTFDAYFSGAYNRFGAVTDMEVQDMPESAYGWTDH